MGMGVLRSHWLHPPEERTHRFQHSKARGWGVDLSVDGEGHLPNIHVELIETKPRISFYYAKTLRLSVASGT